MLARIAFAAFIVAGLAGSLPVRAQQEDVSGTEAPAARFAEAEALRRGLDGPRDLAAAEEIHRALAEAGFERAFLPLGLIYEATGRPGQAIDAYREALDAPNGARARVRLALGNLEGAFGELSDPEAGFEEIRRIAAEDESDLATFYIGFAHEFGLGTEQDIDAAVAVYRDLADRGNAQAHVRLGQIALKGKAGAPSPRDAARHFEAAVEGGVDNALVGLSLARSASGESGAALDAIEEGVARGARRAEYHRALGHHEGTFGPASDRAFGAAELKRLAERGNLDAALAALRYHPNEARRIEGLDLERAIATVRRAAEAGDGWATAALARAYRRLGDEIPDARARHARLIDAHGDTMIARLQTVERVHALYDPDRPIQSRSAVQARLGEATADGFVAGLEQLRRMDANAFVYTLQTELGTLGYGDCGRSGQLTRCTLRSLMRFCKAHGIFETCRRGPLGAPVARTIAEELHKARGQSS